VEINSFNGWHSILEARHVSRDYATGYFNAILSMYPAPEVRIVKVGTGEVIKEHTGNRKPAI
jgi:hypothetical protein